METGSVYEEHYAEAKVTKTKDIAILGLLIALCAAIAVFFLFKQSLRLDEAQSLWQTSRTPGKILQIVAQDVHVPLYHISLHYWQLLFGNSVPSARLFSLIFFLLSIPATFALGKEAYSRRVGLFAAALVSVSPFINWYGSEIRMYSLLVFITLLNQYFFLRVYKRGDNKAYIGFAITSLLGIFTHYFFIFSLFSQAVFYILKRTDFPIGTGKKFAYVSALLAAAFIPWLVFVKANGFAATTQPHLDKPTTYNLFDTVTQFVFGFQNQDLSRIIISLWPILVLLALFALNRDKRDPSRRGKGMNSVTGYFLLTGFLPMILVFFISFIKPSYLSRYLIFSAPSVYIFLGWLIYAHFNKRIKLVQGVIIGLMVIMLGIQTTSAATPVKENYKDAVDYVAEKSTSQDVFLVTAPFTIYPVEYYYHGTAKLQTIPFWDRYKGGLPVFNENELPSEIDSMKDQYRYAWILTSYDQGYNDKIRLYMDTHFQRIDQKEFSSGVQLYAYKLRYDTK